MTHQLPTPPPDSTAVLPNGSRVRLAARRFPGGLLESTLRPALARIHVDERSLPPAQGILEVDGPASAALARRLTDQDLAVTVPSAQPEPPCLTHLSVVVPVRDRAEALDRLLCRLLGGLPEERRPRVIVVNDASADAPRLSAVTARHGAHQVDLPVNVGPAGARNAGLAHVETPFVAFVDSDVAVTAEQLERLLAEFSDPLLAVTAPRVVAPRTPARTRTDPPAWGVHAALARYERWMGPLDVGSTPGLVGPSRRLTYVPSACWVARTSTVGDGFSAELRVGEDVDLVWRLTDAGWRVRYVPDVNVAHTTREDAAGWWRQHAGYGLSSAPLAQRHPGRLAPARYNATGLAVAASMMAPWPVFALTSAAAYSLSWWRLRRRMDRFDSADAVAGRLAWAGLSANVGQTASWSWRYGLPVLLPAALVCRPARRLLLRGLVVDTVVTVSRRSRRNGDVLDVLAVVAGAAALPARAAENAAFAWGVLSGCLRYRTLAPLIPALIRRPS
ncbi:mycofactocin biosynthesis glycosyltransferase MftF [Citricoccus sp. GCM10030269]|uniref:mycofactocin biosynthesis glycosyltransferase MftF n=1 Tax=Citricoccus sp. GCM10030269 TaxID=3273388 RepID=UPI00360A787D